MSDLPKIFDHLPALCNQIKRLAVEAGDLTLDYFDESGYQGMEIKGDGSPVTLADQKAEKLIENALMDISTLVPMVGEEATADGRIPDLSQQRYFWLVDPLDGTKEFIKGSGDYTVNIALICDHEPVLGVVYAPFHGELYAGCGIGTAVRWFEDSDKEKPIKTRSIPSKGLTVASSRSHGDGGRQDQFLDQFKIEKVVRRGSSLKMTSIASGKADLYPRFGPTCEWDTAAADAILRSAGGIITDLQGNQLTYGGNKPGFLNPEFIAWSGDVYNLYQSLRDETN